MQIDRRKVLSGLGFAIVGCGGDPEPNEPGAPVPRFSLQDFQPKSARFGEAYGAEEFHGSVLVLPLFAGWCPDCLGCAYFLDELYKDWLAEGLNVRVMSINSIDGRTYQDDLIEVCDFPLLQDTESAKVWNALRGTKDDHYIYTAESVLHRFFDYEGDVEFDTLSEQGRATLRTAIIAAGA